MRLPVETTKSDWIWKAENFVRWIESGVLLKEHGGRVDCLAGEYHQIYQEGVIAGKGALQSGSFSPPKSKNDQ